MKRPSEWLSEDKVFVFVFHNSFILRFFHNMQIVWESEGSELTIRFIHVQDKAITRAVQLFSY